MMGVILLLHTNEAASFFSLSVKNLEVRMILGSFKITRSLRLSSSAILRIGTYVIRPEDSAPTQHSQIDKSATIYDNNDII